MKKIGLTISSIALLVCLFCFRQLYLKEKKSMKLLSSAFKNGDVLPKKYSCDGENVNPPLRWENSPEGTKSFIVIMDDPDAPATKPEPWVHWIVFNIPSDVNKLDENAEIDRMKDAKQGLTNSGKSKFHGACPPSGVHRYYFTLYALDTMLDLQEGVSKKDLLNDAEGHLLSQAQLMATYERK